MGEGVGEGVGEGEGGKLIRLYSHGIFFKEYVLR